MHLLLLAVLALQSLGTANEPARGELCVQEPLTLMVAKRCWSVEGTSLEVELAQEERVFGWISSDRSTIALGVIQAEEDRIRIPDGPTLELEIKGSPDRNWPQGTTLAIGTKDAPYLWQIELSAIDVTRLRRILLPSGTWDIRVKAERHSVTTLAATKVVELTNLGVITLRPLPQIRGRVINRDGEFLRSAIMISEEGEVLATSDNFGEILYEAPCREEADCMLPARFRVEYPGTVPASIAVANRSRDLDFDTLRLARGGTLKVNLERSGVESPLTVEILLDRRAPLPSTPHAGRTFSDDYEIANRNRLRREAPDLFTAQQSFPLIDSATVGEEQTSVTFENLPEGQLRLVVRGREQGEFLSRLFHVEPEESTTMDVEIQPAEITVDVSRDGKPVEGVPIQIAQWNVPGHQVQTPPTNVKGRSSVTIWEKGRHSAHLLDSKNRAAVTFEVGDAKAQNISIHVTPASISGRIVEATTEKPIAGVSLLFDDVFYRGAFAPVVVTDDDGRFEVDGIMTGPYYYRLHVDGFLPIERGGEIRRGHNDLGTIRLGRGVEYRVRAVWEDGRPIPGAVYLEKSDLYGLHVADDDGEITFTRGIPLFRPIPFWIVPPEGSFARGERGSNQELTIRVLRPGNALDLDFENADREPVPFAHLTLLWNGHALPRETRLAIESIQNKRFRSGNASRLTLEGMPPGQYLFSALQSFADNPWLPPGPWPPITTVHYSGMEQTAKVRVWQSPPKR